MTYEFELMGGVKI